MGLVVVWFIGGGFWLFRVRGGFVKGVEGKGKFVSVGCVAWEVVSFSKFVGSRLILVFRSLCAVVSF